MVTYTVLASFTDQGIRNVKETTHRAEAVEAGARKMGITVKSINWTLAPMTWCASSRRPATRP